MASVAQGVGGYGAWQEVQGRPTARVTEAGVAEGRGRAEPLGTAGQGESAPERRRETEYPVPSDGARPYGGTQCAVADERVLGPGQEHGVEPGQGPHDGDGIGGEELSGGGIRAAYPEVGRVGDGSLRAIQLRQHHRGHPGRGQEHSPPSTTALQPE